MPEFRGSAVFGLRTMTSAATATAAVRTMAVMPSAMMRQGSLPGPEDGWPGPPLAAPPAACWPGVALVVMAVFSLARPVGTARSHAEHSGMSRCWSPRSGARSGRRAADEEHGRVVIERVADVAQHGGAQRVQDLVGLAGLADGAAPGEREELTGPAARLADAVGVEQ